MNFATKLRYLMTREGLTQDALSEQLEISSATVWKWLTGSVPRAQMAQGLADFFEVDVNDLLDDTRDILNKNSGPLTEEQKRAYYAQLSEIRIKMEAITRRREAIFKEQINNDQELMNLREEEFELVRKITSEAIGDVVSPPSPSEPEIPMPPAPSTSEPETPKPVLRPKQPVKSPSIRR